MKASSKNYWGVIRTLGSWAIGAFVFGLLFKPILQNLLPINLRDDVIMLALPFVAYFAAILLLFILGINLISKRLHMSIPHRTHQAVEYTIIAGILAGIIALFQPWTIGPFRYGFSLLLFSTLAFILWSHVTPQSAQNDSGQSPYSQKAVRFGLIVAILIALFISSSLALNSRPREPYGVRQRQWNLMPEEQKEAAIAKAQADYRKGYLPFFVVYGVLPGLLSFFLIREFATPKKTLKSS